MRKFVYVVALAGFIVGALLAAIPGYYIAYLVFGFACAFDASVIQNSCLYGKYGVGMVLFTGVPALIGGAIGAALGAFLGALLDKAVTDISNRKKNA